MMTGPRDIDRATLDHASLKQIARAMGRRLDSLFAQSASTDPFVADMPHRRKKAEWFAALWQHHDLQRACTVAAFTISWYRPHRSCPMGGRTRTPSTATKSS